MQVGNFFNTRTKRQIKKNALVLGGKNSKKKEKKNRGSPYQLYNAISTITNLYMIRGRTQIITFRESGIHGNPLGSQRSSVIWPS